MGGEAHEEDWRTCGVVVRWLWRAAAAAQTLETRRRRWQDIDRKKLPKSWAFRSSSCA